MTCIAETLLWHSTRYQTRTAQHRRCKVCPFILQYRKNLTEYALDVWKQRILIGYHASVEHGASRLCLQLHQSFWIQCPSIPIVWHHAIATTTVCAPRSKLWLNRGTLFFRSQIRFTCTSLREQEGSDHRARLTHAKPPTKVSSDW